MKRLPVILAIAACGCATGRQYFEPSERVQGQTLQGHKVAIYPLSVATGPFGEAKVWSRGAYEIDEGALLHVGLEIHNTGRVPVELRPGDVRLDVLTEDHGPIRGLRPVAEGARAFAPGTIGEANLRFALPQDVSPNDVMALRLHWRLHVNGYTYVQRTPFAEEIEARYASPAYAYPCWPYGPYDCMYMHPFGFRYYDRLVVPRYVPSPGSRTRVRPDR